MAANGLAQAARNVARPLASGDLDQARLALGMIVGRDTATLPPEEIIRGVVETVAENTVDGVLSPLIYAFVGGAPLAMAYKAINTLDSMVGHLDDRYRYFGWASARLDDLANLIPARCSALLLTLAACLRRHDGLRAVKTAWLDARQHPSPNGGWPEASVAGALGVRLGGINFYDGEPEVRAYMGDPLRPLHIGDIEQTVGLMTTATILAAVIGLALSYAL
jgi:adenosylcobinamide-phosphate synthase